MQTVKAGMVGLGLLGELHLRHLQETMKNVEVVAVCDMVESRVKEMQEKYHVAEGYTDYDEMLEKADIDAVFIITNVQAHKEQIVKACEHKLHIFCEKPLSLIPEECREIEEAVAKNESKIFTLGFMRRFDVSYAAAMEKVRAGEIGDIIMFKSTSLDAVDTIDINLEKALSGAFHPWFFEMGIHDCDLCRWFIGSEPERVFATGGSYVRPEFSQVDDYDNGFALAHFQNGSCAYIHVGKSAPSCDVEAEIIGTKGTIRVNSVPRRNRVELYKDGKRNEDLIFDFYEKWEDAFYREKVEFINCILEGRKPEITVEDGTKSLEFALMLQESYVTKGLVTAE